LCVCRILAQDAIKNICGSGISLSGKIQTDMLLPENDSTIQTESYNEDVLSNTYIDLNLEHKYLTAGARFEMFESPLPGYEREYKGAGIPYYYLTGNLKNVEATLGSFYEQFGNGLILRTYEERSLGIDNSLRGLRLRYSTKGLYIKALTGQQRYYWKYTDGFVSGTDAEIHLEDFFELLHSTILQFGASFVSKHQSDENILVSKYEKLNLPENVGTFGGRAFFRQGNVDLTAEYAVKANDPSFDNGYIYKNGSALFLSVSWSKRGIGAVVQAKRSENMSFRSIRTVSGRLLYINHLPAFTRQHTYTLPALYPYSTRPDGEWAYQAELTRSISHGSLRLHYSLAKSIDRRFPDGQNSVKAGTKGYESAFFKSGNEIYYQDFNIEMTRSYGKNIKLNIMYMNQLYNQEAVEGHANNGKNIRSNIFVADARFIFNKNLILRNELQYLQTRQDNGDWIFGLAELTFLQKFMASISDLYNSGLTDVHYYMASIAWSQAAHRIQASYGRTRAGFNCSGGLCRYVPASRGFQVSYITSF
jgi:hypothetical protein